MGTSAENGNQMPPGFQIYVGCYPESKEKQREAWSGKMQVGRLF